MYLNSGEDKKNKMKTNKTINTHIPPFRTKNSQLTPGSNEQIKYEITPQNIVKHNTRNWRTKYGFELVLNAFLYKYGGSKNTMVATLQIIVPAITPAMPNIFPKTILDNKLTRAATKR